MKLVFSYIYENASYNTTGDNVKNVNVSSPNGMEKVKSGYTLKNTSSYRVLQILWKIEHKIKIKFTPK